MTDFVNQLLTRRGVETVEAQKRFLTPDYVRDLHDPFLFTQMGAAVERVLAAVKQGEKITIFADYDADGVPAAVVLSEFFRKIGHSNFDVYIPHRHEEDFGLSEWALEKIVARGTKLVITVDCGIAGGREAAWLKQQGVDLIITDHHLPSGSPFGSPEGELPPAVAVLDPKVPGETYPEKNLCGAGVAFKFVQALVRSFPDIPDHFEKWLLDLVAIATVADMVPLLGENRALVYFGLKVLRRTNRPGLLSLIRVLKLEPQYLTEDDIAFSLGPRLNSASRMTHGIEAYELLTTTDPERAAALAAHLDRKNRERRSEVDKILAAVQTRLAEAVAGPVLIFGDESWSLGVLGLAASRLAEELSRPVFVWGKNGQGLLKGSCRSVSGVNVVELMKLADNGGFFANFGGHAASGGFSLAPEKLPELSSRLAEAWERLAPSTLAAEVLAPDIELLPEKVNDDFFVELNQLAPFGLGNPKPLILLRAAKVEKKALFGGNRDHLELFLANNSSRPLRAIKFFFNSDPLTENFLRSGANINIQANLEKSYYRGRPELRLRIVELSPAS